MIWSILGISVAVVAVFCVTVAETLVGTPVFEACRPHIAIGLGVIGAVAWFIGRALASRRSNSRSFLLFDLRYWGPVLVAFGVITLFIRPLRREQVEKPAPIAQPKPRPAAPVVVQKPVEPAPEPAKPAAVFPALKMQGVIFKESKPVAIINGQSYSVGDSLDGAVVVRAIQRDSVMLELAGEMKVLSVY